MTGSNSSAAIAGFRGSEDFEDTHDFLRQIRRIVWLIDACPYLRYYTISSNWRRHGPAAELDRP